MNSDPILDEIRRVRHEMSAEIGHDPRRLLEYYAEIQQRYRDRLVNYSRPGRRNVDTHLSATPAGTDSSHTNSSAAS